MSAALQTILPAIAWSGNPLHIELASDDYRSQTGAAAVYVLQVKSNIVAGQSFRLFWASADLVFTTADNPDTSGLQLPVGDATAAYANQLAAALRQQYFVDRDFTISYVLNGGYHSVQLTAKEAGSRFNLLPVSSPYFELLQATAGADDTVRSNFAHHLQVFLSDQKIYENNLALDYPYTGSTTKDIAQILHDRLGYDIPALDQVWQECNKSVQSYKLKYAQFFGDTPEVKQLQETATYTICLGGYSKKALTRINNADYLGAYLLPAPNLFRFQRWFESWPVDEFFNPTNAPLFLYFMNMREVAEDLSLLVKVDFSDETSDDVYIPGGIVQPHQKIAIGCGYQQLGLPAINTAARTILKYSVQVVATATHESRSVIKMVNITRDAELYTRYILYADSAGNFKTLHSYGTQTASADVSADLAERDEDKNTPLNGAFSRYAIKLTENFELNTGYLVGDQSQDALQELLLSRHAFRVIGETLVPIIITNKKADMQNDGQNLQALKIEYRLAYDEKYFTASGAALIVPRLNDSQQALNDI